MADSIVTDPVDIDNGKYCSYNFFPHLISKLLCLICTLAEISCSKLVINMAVELADINASHLIDNHQSIEVAQKIRSCSLRTGAPCHI